MDKIYEIHSYKNKNLPIICHTDRKKNKDFTYIHWHENIEILFVIEGTGDVFIDEHIVRAGKGDIVVINTQELHATRTTDELFVYFCLIIDKSFCEQMGFRVDEQQICSLIKNRSLFEKLNNIKSELSEQKEYYIPAVMSNIIELLTELYRNYPFKNTKIKNNKNLDMIKKGISYIKKNFNKPMTLNDIANHTGYSKYYFCRCFKDVTGITVNSYINSVKTEHAKEFLKTKEYTVGEVSDMCGFSDISYFTKIFKKHTGILPSKI